MRRPSTPPAWMESVSSLAKSGRLRRAVEHGGPTDDGSYLHWDELRRRRPPGDLTVEEWWTATKLYRAANTRHVPLRSTAGGEFGYVMTDRMQEAWHDFDTRTRGAVEMPEQVTNPESRDLYYVSSIIEEAITSSQLEGAATTRHVAKEMLRTGRKPSDGSERMILNNYLTMRRIREIKDQPLSPELVFELHASITAGTLEMSDQAGRFRRSDERVEVADAYDQVLHVPPPADELAARMRAMCDFANGLSGTGFVHPVLRAIVLHFWLAYDHPFVDGNGRTARALFYWCMLRNRYWLFEYISISQAILKAPARYGRAFLFTETDGNDLTYFVLYHLDVIKRAVDGLHEYIRRKAEQTRRAEPLLRSAPLLNHRQRALLTHALRHPGYRYSFRWQQTTHDVVYQTARTDLLGLEELRLLDRTQVKNRLYFTAAQDLEARIEEVAATLA